MWNDLDSLVEASMQEWQVPGLALAVIQDGEIAVLKGYGVRDTATGLPVTTARMPEGASASVCDSAMRSRIEPQ